MNQRSAEVYSHTTWMAALAETKSKLQLHSVHTSENTAVGIHNRR